MLQSMGLQRVGHDLTNEQQQKKNFFFKKELYCVVISSFEFLIIFICGFPFFP